MKSTGVGADCIKLQAIVLLEIPGFLTTDQTIKLSHSLTPANQEYFFLMKIQGDVTSHRTVTMLLAFERKKS